MDMRPLSSHVWTETPVWEIGALAQGTLPLQLLEGAAAAVLPSWAGVVTLVGAS